MLAQPIVCRQFIGRQEELQFLHGRRELARARQGGLVLVAGEAGIGKSRLVAEFRESLLKARVRIATSYCREFAQRPYAPVLDVLAKLDLARRGLDPKAAAFAEPSSRADHFEAILAAFREVAQRRSVLAVIEDLHWADPASLELLAALVREFEADRLLIVATLRPEAFAEAPERRAALAKLQRLHNTSMLTLPPLGDAELRSFIGTALEGVADLPAETRANVLRLSEGNPFFAEELLKSAADQSSAEPAALPTTLRAVIADHLRPLGAQEQEILAQASVIGRTFSLELLQTTLGRPREAILLALRRARDLQLVTEEGADVFSFRHALTREVIYANFLSLQARELHRRIAQTLEEMTERRPLEALAYHWWAAGEREKAAEFGQRAGDAAAAVFAHEDATQYYRYSLDSVAGGSLDEARLHRKIGNAYAASGSHSAARDAHARAMRLFRELGDLSEECECAGLLAVDLQRLGDPERVAPLEELMARVDRNEQPALWAALGVRAALLSPLPVRAPQVRVLLDEVERYIGPADSLDRLRFHGARAELLRATSVVDEYAVELETMLGIATRLERVDAKANILANAAHTFTNFGKAGLAGAYFDQATAFARLHRHTGTMSLVHSWKALHLFLTGELAAARESVRAALHIPTDHVLTRVNVAAWGTLIGLSLDDPALTDRTYDERLVDGSAGSGWLVYLAAGYAAYLESRGRRAEAQELLHRSLRGLEYEAGLVLTLLAVARLGALDDVPAAHTLLLRGRECRDTVSESALPLFDALVARRQGDRGQAAACGREAVDAFHRLGYRLLEAEAHELAGRPEAAAELYRSTGAAGPLRRLAHTPAPAREGKVVAAERTRGGLTPREEEVATLVARGWSNAEIGERLGLSTKGVEKHLSSVYRKIGLSSRARLVSYMLGAATGEAGAPASDPLQPKR